LQRVLAYALEESEKLKHKHIGTEHMVLGLLREEGSLAANLLVKAGLSLESVREFLQKKGSE
jgi:ATP-dependent Clp protease ATP-binding subunit ClpC